MSGRSAKAVTTLGQLDEAAAQATPLQALVTDRVVLQNLSRAQHALIRRIDVWRRVCDVEVPNRAEGALPNVDPQAMAECLAAVDELLRDSPQREAWGEFLDLPGLRAWLAVPSPSRRGDRRVPRGLAEQIFKRLDATAMSPAQHQLISTGPIAALRQELLRHVAETVDTAAMLHHLECYEQTGLPADGRLLAQDCGWLALSPRRLRLRWPSPRTIAMPTSASPSARNCSTAWSPTRSGICQGERNPGSGWPSRGQSMTHTILCVVPRCQPNRALLALQVSGRVSSLTSATSGPATFVNDTNSSYTAVKPLAVDLSGIRLGETQVEVDNQITLRNVTTDFDGIPLVSDIAKGVARSQREAKTPDLTREVKEKVAATARRRIDAETATRFTRLAGRLQEKVFAPLDTLALEPAMVAAQTTPQRVILRLRLAAEGQLGSHTPRPQAPGDSLASFQIHESVLNNAIGQLDLDGRTFTLPQLSRHIADCLSRPTAIDDNPDHEDVSITFAPRDAVRVCCAEGRMEVTVSIARLAKGEHFWKHFQVRAFYRPQCNGPVAELARDGVIQLLGPRLSTGRESPCGESSRTPSRSGALEAHARAICHRSAVCRRGDHAIRDRRRLDRHCLGRSARGPAAGRGAKVVSPLHAGQRPQRGFHRPQPPRLDGLDGGQV